MVKTKSIDSGKPVSKPPALELQTPKVHSLLPTVYHSFEMYYYIDEILSHLYYLHIHCMVSKTVILQVS